MERGRSGKTNWRCAGCRKRYSELRCGKRHGALRRNPARCRRYQSAVRQNGYESAAPAAGSGADGHEGHTAHAPPAAPAPAAPETVAPVNAGTASGGATQQEKAPDATPATTPKPSPVAADAARDPRPPRRTKKPDAACPRRSPPRRQARNNRALQKLGRHNSSDCSSSGGL